jgi:hypothetical protein
MLSLEHLSTPSHSCTDAAVGRPATCTTKRILARAKRVETLIVLAASAKTATASMCETTGLMVVTDAALHLFVGMDATPCGEISTTRIKASTLKKAARVWRRRVRCIRHLALKRGAVLGSHPVLLSENMGDGVAAAHAYMNRQNKLKHRKPTPEKKMSFFCFNSLVELVGGGGGGPPFSSFYFLQACALPSELRVEKVEKDARTQKKQQKKEAVRNTA